MDSPSDEDLLVLCERYFLLSQQKPVLLAQAAGVTDADDPDAVGAIADALDDLDAECRILLWRIYELSLSPQTSSSSADHRSSLEGAHG